MRLPSLWQFAAALLLCLPQQALAGMGMDVALGQRRSAWSSQVPGQMRAQGRETTINGLWAPLDEIPVALTAGYTVVTFAQDDDVHDFTGTETAAGLQAWLRLAPVLTASLAYERVLASRYQYVPRGSDDEGSLRGQGQAYGLMLAWEVLPLAHIFLKGRWQNQDLAGNGARGQSTSLAAWQGQSVKEASQSLLAGFGLRL